MAAVEDIDSARAAFERVANATSILGCSGLSSGPPTPPTEYAAVLEAACDQERNRSEPFGDGDQSLIRHDGPEDTVAQGLKNVWVQGGDFFPLLQSRRLGDCMLHAILGEPMHVRAALAKARAAGGDALTQVLERRETMLRVTPLHGAIMGALQIGRQNAADHVQVTKMLLEAGARPDAKDIAGYTPMHRCANAMANEITLEIGMLLIEHRADANAMNRFGDAPLMEAVMGNRADCAALLCEGGADPMLPSHFSGIVPFKMDMLDFALELKEVFSHAVSRKAVAGSCRLQGSSVTLHNLSRTELNGRRGTCGKLVPSKKRYAVTLADEDGVNEQTLLVALKNIRVNRGLEGQRVALKGLSKEELNGRQGVCGAFHEDRGRWAVTLDGDMESIAVKQVNLEVLRELFTCTHCGKQAAKMPKCQKCFKARFCSERCMESGFSAHREVCLQWRQGQVTVDPRTCGPANGTFLCSWSDPSRTRMDVGDNPRGKSKTTVVKVQIPQEDPGGDLLVYNEKRDLYFMIAREKCAEHAAIFQSVSNKGVVGRKAYFPARLARDGSVTINYLEHLPPEHW